MTSHDSRRRPRVAQIFATDTGIEPGPGRVLIDDVTEQARLLGFLNGGVAILESTAQEADRLDPGRGEPVPIGFRTDGTWVWSESVAYYLLAHGVSPEPAFYTHIRLRRYRCAIPGSRAADRALSTLYELIDRLGPNAADASTPR